MNNGAGKGDKYRPVDQKKWDEGWESAFGKKTKKKKKKDKDNERSENRKNGNR